MAARAAVAAESACRRTWFVLRWGESRLTRSTRGGSTAAGPLSLRTRSAEHQSAIRCAPILDRPGTARAPRSLTARVRRARHGSYPPDGARPATVTHLTAPPGHALRGVLDSLRDDE